MVIKCASTTTQVREKKFIATGQVRDCFSDMKNNTLPYRKKDDANYRVCWPMVNGRMARESG
jgi:hypothetical protein